MSESLLTFMNSHLSHLMVILEIPKRPIARCPRRAGNTTLREIKALPLPSMRPTPLARDAPLDLPAAIIIYTYIHNAHRRRGEDSPQHSHLMIPLLGSFVTLWHTPKAKATREELRSVSRKRKINNLKKS